MLASIIDIDHHIFHLINSEWTNTFFDTVMPIIRNKITWIPLYFTLFIWIIFKEKLQALRYIVVVIVCVSLSDLLCSQVLKNIFERIRPCDLSEGIEQVRVLIKCSNGYSMPSAHASNHACLAILFSYFFYNYYKSIGAVIFFFMWALSIAYAQVYVGVHFPLDVMVGCIFGATLGILGVLVYRKNGALVKLSHT